MKKMSKSILACLLVLVLMIGIFPYSATAAETVHVYIGHTFWGYGSNVFNYQLQDGAHSADLSGLNLHYIQETGRIAYCMEPDRGSHTSATEYTNQDDKTLWGMFSGDQQRAIRTILAYGAPNGISSSDEWKNYGYEGATQVLIWEIIMGLRNPSTFERTSSRLYDLVLSWCYPGTNEKAGYQEGYSAIEAKCKAHGKVPSFTYASESMAAANPIVMDYDPATGICKKTLTDTNSVINNDFPFNSVSGLTISKSGNQLTVSCKYSDFAGKDIPTLKAIGSNPDTNNLAVAFWGNAAKDQTVCTTGKPDPTPVYVKLKLPELPKISTTASFSTGEKTYLPLSEVSIVDTISYKNLNAGTKYKMVGTLVDTSGNAIQVDGKKVTAEQVFTPTSANGEVKMTFTLNASALAGKSVVAYEKLYLENGTLVASHEDPSDKNQTVSFYQPSIKTTATFDNQSKTSHKTSSVTIVDTVSYTGLMTGKDYTVSGTLMFRDSSGKAVKVMVDGKEVTASTTFTAKSADGSVNLSYTFDASKVAPDSVTVYESLYLGKDLLATHQDINDKEQTVSFSNPSIKTTATFDNQGKTSHKTDSVTILDTVSCSNLMAGEEYTVSGVLMYRNSSGNAEKVMINGKEVTASKTFTAESASASVTLSYTFDATKFAPDSVTVFESLYLGEDLLATHQDINDREQTVSFSNPSLKTTATFSNQGKVFHKTNSVTIIDTVSYSNLMVGEKYTVSGVLMYLDENGKAAKVMVNGREVTASKSFTAGSANGTVTLSYTFDATNFSPDSVTVFESLYLGTNLLATHQDINDKEQTVSFANPSIGTTATFNNDEKLSHKLDEVTIVDAVTYNDLIPGEKYAITGILMTKDEDGNAVPLQINGESITAGTTFVAPAATGMISLSYTFDASELETDTIVVYESLYIESTLLASHQDINDEGQTVHFVTPSIQTEALFEDGLKISDPLSTVTIIDTVTCEDLLIGHPYFVEGTLMVESVDEEGNPVYALIENEDGPVTATYGFIAEDTIASIEMPFTIDASDLRSKHIVVFETLYAATTEEDNDGNQYFEQSIVLTEHKDLTDEKQTVEFSNPELGTVALFGNKSHTYQLKTVKKDAELPSEIVTLVDTISYKGLTAGATYTAEGRLMLITTAADGTKTVEPLKVDGKEVTSIIEFVPESAEGTAEVTFKFDAKDLDGKSVVAFETVKRGEDILAEHNDPTDKEQTVNFLRTIETGGMPDWVWLAMAGGLLAIAIILLLVLRSYKKKRK